MTKMRVTKLMHELLKRVVTRGVADRFILIDVTRLRDRMRFAVPLEGALDLGLIERVGEGCGKWFYKLTDLGRDFGARKKLPNLREVMKGKT